MDLNSEPVDRLLKVRALAGTQMAMLALGFQVCKFLPILGPTVIEILPTLGYLDLKGLLLQF